MEGGGRIRLHPLCLYQTQGHLAINQLPLPPRNSHQEKHTGRWQRDKRGVDGLSLMSEQTLCYLLIFIPFLNTLDWAVWRKPDVHWLLVDLELAWRRHPRSSAACFGGACGLNVFKWSKSISVAELSCTT